MTSAKKILVLGISTLCLGIAASANVSLATSQNDNYEKIIKTNFSEFEKLLNANDEPEKLMQLLHDTIDNDAKFTMILNSPDKQAPSNVEVTLTKADYINSYIYGPKQVKDYSAHLEIKNIKFDIANDVILSEEEIVETGIIKDPANPKAGKDFTSKTTCLSKHSIQDAEHVVLEESACKTDITYLVDV